MQIIEFNAGTLRPPGGIEVWGADHLVCRCLAVRCDDVTVLVDAGIGLHDIDNPTDRLGEQWVAMAAPDLDPSETLVRQLPQVGIKPESVRHIVLTHQHNDHVGGLADFPEAQVHATSEMRDAVLAATGDDLISGVPAQWKHGVRWASAPQPGPLWHGLHTMVLPGLPGSIRLVPLPGHACGHAGVLIADGSQWVLHAGDAIFHPAQYCGGDVPVGPTGFATAVEYDASQRISTEQVLSTIARNQWATIVSSHGPDGLFG